VNTRGLFSSANDEWSTPQDFFEELNAVFHFDLDACATPANAKCRRYFTKADDALKQTWTGTVWMNPPYGRQIEAFMKKACESFRDGATVVCLVPVRTDTRWWQPAREHGLDAAVALPRAAAVLCARSRTRIP